MCIRDRYYSVLCTYCYRFVRLEDAEEIVQDVMLWLWENRERPVIEYSLKQYLFKAVYHRCSQTGLIKIIKRWEFMITILYNGRC